MLFMLVNLRTLLKKSVVANSMGPSGWIRSCMIIQTLIMRFIILCESSLCPCGFEDETWYNIERKMTAGNDARAR